MKLLKAGCSGFAGIACFVNSRRQAVGTIEGQKNVDYQNALEDQVPIVSQLGVHEWSGCKTGKGDD